MRSSYVCVQSVIFYQKKSLANSFFDRFSFPQKNTMKASFLLFQGGGKIELLRHYSVVWKTLKPELTLYERLVDTY